ncbi:MAG TPA: hypothetical protein VN848_10520 [Gemmatimonadales bacterium]|nr:hypothetical protein [Gemmatimonadales bacterium]
MTDSNEQKPRDFDAELRAIDRLIEKPAPSVPSSDPSPAATPLPPPRTREITGVQWLGTWARVILGVLVGIGMTQWPYTHGCGWRFMFYLTGIGVVLTAGLWSSLSSWKRRLGVAHLLSQLLIIWGLVLGARAILPRIGYAKVSAPWLCPDDPASTRTAEMSFAVQEADAVVVIAVDVDAASVWSERTRRV